MSSDECSIGKNGCFPLQEQSKVVSTLELRVDIMDKKIEEACISTNDIKSLLWKGMLLITAALAVVEGGIQIVIRLVGK
jgi:hypothetical protein